MDNEVTPENEVREPSAPTPPRGGGSYKIPRTIDELESIEAEPVEFVHETMSRRVYGLRVFVRRALIVLGIMLVVFGGIAVAAYAYFVPKILSALPSSSNSPRAAFPAYKRVIQAMVDYFPTVTAERPASGRIADAVYGGSLALISSADVVRGRGMDGVLRMDIDDPQPLRGTADLEVRYRLTPASSSPDFSVYFLFSQWPGEFEASVPFASLKDTWFHFDSKTHAQALSAAGRAYGQGGLLLSTTTQARLIESLWRHALASRALSWKIESLFRRSVFGSFVTDIGITLNELRTAEFVKRLESDEAFMKEFRGLMNQKVGGASFRDMLLSLRSLRGRLTIGIGDRGIYESRWQYEIAGSATGNMRGFFNSSVSKLRVLPELAVPASSQDVSDFLSSAVPALLSPSVTDAPGTADSDRDADGLTDEEEPAFGTDPDIADTDGDGYRDGDEVIAGYNPTGEGKLE